MRKEWVDKQARAGYLRQSILKQAFEGKLVTAVSEETGTEELSSGTRSWLSNLSVLHNLPDPNLLALDIIENLESALSRFRQIVSQLQATSGAVMKL